MGIKFGKKEEANSTPQSATATPKAGGKFQHKELEALVKNPAITRVKEQGLYGTVKRLKNGSASIMFRWRFRHNGKHHDFTAGTWPGNTLKEIRDAHAWAVEQHGQGKNPNASRMLAKLQASEAQAETIRIHQEETVKTLALKWQSLELTKRVSGEQEIGRYDNGSEAIRSFEKDVFPRIGEKPVQSVTKTMCLDCLNGVKERGALSMANRLLVDMTQFFNWCRMEGRIDTNPLQDVRRKQIGGIATPRDRVLWDTTPNASEPEAELLELQARLPTARLKRKSELALWILLSTAARVGELSKAQWKHIDFEKRIWFLPDTKNGKPHHIHLSEFSWLYFRELYNLTGSNSWVLPGTNRLKDGNQASHVCEKSLAKQFTDRQRLEAMSGRSKHTGTLLLPGGHWTPHDLRRTAATIMAHLRVPVEIIEKCLNHTSDNPLIAVYQVSNRFEEQQVAWNKLGSFLDRVLHGKTAEIIPLHKKSA